jgi:uncharacterized membrane protein YsdA (DUF1294 family)
MDKRRVNPYIFFGSWVAIVSVAIAVLGYVFFNLTALAAYFVGINFGGFVLVGLDKSLAQSGSLRAPEKIILAVAALGGAAGILLAMRFARHKTKKTAFQAALVLIIGAQVIIASQLGVKLRQVSSDFQ